MRYILLVFMLFINPGCDYAPTEHSHEHVRVDGACVQYTETNNGTGNNATFLCTELPATGMTQDGEYTFTKANCLEASLTYIDAETRWYQWTDLTCEEFCESIDDNIDDFADDRDCWD